MTFQAYLDNIEKLTGKRPADFHAAAKAKGLGADITATEFVAWLKDDFGLGHGHSMALWAVFKSKGWVEAAGKKPPAKKAASKPKKKPE